MKRQQRNPIDPVKLRSEIFKRNLSLADVSESLGYNKNQMSCVLSQSLISKPVMKGLEREYGIKYEDYKPEEPKPKEESKQESMPETIFTDKTEQMLKTIIAQLGMLNNNIVAMSALLRQIDTDIKRWECDD